MLRPSTRPVIGPLLTTFALVSAALLLPSPLGPVDEVAAADAVVGGPCAEQAVHSVIMRSSRFAPDQVNVASGDVVVWTHTDPSGLDIQHTTTRDTSPGLWDSDQMVFGEHFSVQFCSTGTFSYECVNHPPLMIGTITVT